jgi:DNA-binding response OmpR family regulator
MTVPPFAPPASRGRILLVEESSVLRELQVLLLRTAGYQVSIAERPAETLHLTQVHRPDVVVINSDDVELRDPIFLSELRYGQPDLCITVMAPLLTSDVVRDLKRTGATAVFDRTHNPAVFVEQIDGVLGRSLLPAASKLTDDDREPADDLPVDRHVGRFAADATTLSA